jgi:hypothetical protein
MRSAFRDAHSPRVADLLWRLVAAVAHTGAVDKRRDEFDGRPLVAACMEVVGAAPPPYLALPPASVWSCGMNGRQVDASQQQQQQQGGGQAEGGGVCNAPGLAAVALPMVGGGGGGGAVEAGATAGQPLRGVASMVLEPVWEEGSMDWQQLLAVLSAEGSPLAGPGPSCF